MSLDFLNSGLLRFLPLAAIPVLLYLFNRQRHKRVEWAAMTFLVRALKKNRRRLKIENLLLLAVRMAVVALIVAAIARPAITGGGLSKALADRRKQVVIVLDGSLSMRHVDDGKTAFARAQDAAARIVRERLKKDDQVGVIVVGAAGARLVYESPRLVDDDDPARGLKAALLADLKELEPSHGPADAAKAFQAVIRYLPRFDAGEAEEAARAAAAGGAGAEAEAARAVAAKEVYFITDMQRSAFATERGVRDSMLGIGRDLEARRAALTIVDVGAEEPDNVAVTGLETQDEIIGVDITFKLRATVKSFARRPLKNLMVSLYVDDVARETKPIELEPGEEGELELYAVAHKPGPLKVSVDVSSDLLASDNRRHLVLEAREALQVLVVDGKPAPDFGWGETDYLVIALAPGDDSQIRRRNLLKPTVITDAQLDEQIQGAELARYSVVILANVLSLTDTQVERLETYVRDGGALLFFLGSQVDQATYNEKLWKGGKGLLPGRIAGLREAGAADRFFRLRAEEFRHPVLRSFETPEDRPLFYEPTFEKYLALEVEEPAPGAGGGGAAPAAAASAAIVVARFERRELADAGERPVGPDGGRPRDGGGGAGAGEAGPGPGSPSDPALVERRFGRGRVAVFASSAGKDWNDFPGRGRSYVPFCSRLVSYLAEAGTARRNLTVGEPIELVLPAAEFTREVLLTVPAEDQDAGGAQIERSLEQISEEGGVDRVRLFHPETWRPGVYEVRFKRQGARPGPGAAPGPRRDRGTGPAAETDDRVELFGVNVDVREESDLTRIDPSNLREIAPELKFEHVRDGAETKGAGGLGDQPAELWRWLLFALLGLLVVESTLACHFGRKAT